jgi:hypothetical protein
MIRTFSLSLIVLLLAACGGTDKKPLDIRIYDPTGRATPTVTTRDVLRSSAKVGEPGRLYFAFTPRGAQRFERLTRALAHLGKRDHRFTRMTISIDGRIYANPSIDYRVNPEGIPGDSGVELPIPQLTALRLARRIRSG